MKINYVTLQTWEPHLEPVCDLPSETRESDYESIESMFARFKVNNGVYELFKPVTDLTAEERDILDNAEDLGDLLDEDISIQKEFIDSVRSSLKTEVKKEKEQPTQPKVEPEKNPATEPEDA